MVRRVPGGQLGFAGGAGGAVDGGQEQVLAHREPLLPFGYLRVDQLDQTDLGGLVVEGGHVAEAGHRGGLRDRRLLGAFDGLHDMIQRPQVGGLDDLGPAVDALAPAGVVVGAPLEDFAGQARHKLGHTIGGSCGVHQAQSIVGTG